MDIVLQAWSVHNFVTVLIDLLYFYLCNGCHNLVCLKLQNCYTAGPQVIRECFCYKCVNVIILNENHAFHKFLNIAFFWDVMPCNLLNMY
jgi:hypothetical protein